MEILEAINKRKSVRGYLDKPVSKETLEEILDLAARAVSAHNVQPWEALVVAGEALEALKEENIKRLYDGGEADFPDPAIPDSYKDRGRELGIELFRLMDIKREDKEKRKEWTERGFRFFDAPAAILLFMDEELDETAYRFDMGCFTQNLCLAAEAKGLGTCVAYQTMTYNKKCYELFGVPESKKFVVGIAIGYEDPEFPANEIKSKRIPMKDLTTWAGFDE